MVKRIGILTGGGDCPGLNSAIKAITYRAIDEGYEVYGILQGWKGLLRIKGEDFGKHMSQIKKIYSMMPQREGFGEYDLADIENSFYKNSNELMRRLNKSNTHNVDRTGGTILGSSRTNPYSTTNEKGETIDQSSIVIKNVKKLGLDGLVAIGGDDTLGVAAKLCDEGVPVVGIPKTIDKDLAGTDYTIGFSTAVGILHRSINQLRTPAGSHKWIHIVEAMGRHAGHLALAGGTAADADMILIPEYDFKIDRVIELIQEQKKEGHEYHIIVVAEGAKPVGGTEVLHSEVKDEFGHARLSGISVLLEEMISNKTGIRSRR
ncbi:MAG: ATP-dependent 6-phosphofructokinase [Candidatus Micrarchaeota archaeon]|nr:ATP-dependent 6-phosphofructokinase [Candidatus Micrarchaeota archaeon]